MPAPNNLPPQLTSFVGREREIAEITRLLDGARLLTLTGTGGCGKTRLALQVAGNLLSEYPDGVWLVELADLTDPTLLRQVVASTLGLREEPGRDVSSMLVEHLKSGKVLLLLDNCEHLVEACALFADELLRACPQLRILATSRQALDAPYEVAWRVPSLSLPDNWRGVPPDTLLKYEAVTLFVDRALLKAPDFELNVANAPAVAQLCYRLDGIPLAIELAAARVRVLAVEQIVERLGERFRLLTSGHLALPRHKTLTALMDWSYDLLSQAERSLLRSLSVLAGGFTLEAVEAVSGEAADQYAIIDLLEQLVDKSLVIAERQKGQFRYRLLETIRQYAWEKLVAAGEEIPLSDRHLNYYLALAERSEDELLGDKQAAWLERLEAEHDNLRAALAWARARMGSDGGLRALRLAGALVWFWYFRGYLSEGRKWLEEILDFGRPEGTRVPDAAEEGQPGSDDHYTLKIARVALAKALSAAGAFAFLQSDYAMARARLEESLQIWRALADKRGTAFALMFLGRSLVRQGEMWGRTLGEESVALFREVDEKWGLALALDFLGEVTRDQGEDKRAAALHDESLELYRTMGHRWGVALELSNFGRVALRQGDYETARARLEEALAIEREVGDKWMIAWTLHSLGDLARYSDDYDRAIEHYDESLSLFRELEDRGGIARSILASGYVAQYLRDYVQAAALYSQAVDMFRTLGDRAGMASALHGLGALALRRGDTEHAASFLGESLALCSVLGDGEVTVDCLELYAELAGSLREFDRAARLLGAADALREQAGTSPHPLEREELERILNAARTGLGENHFSNAWGGGRAMALEQVVAYALGTSSLLPTARGAASGPRERHSAHETTLPGDLTQREVEVVQLIASGLTDMQVAERLVVSPRTVQAHVRSVYAKLGVSTRSALTRWAVEQSLA